MTNSEFVRIFREMAVYFQMEGVHRAGVQRMGDCGRHYQHAAGERDAELLKH